MAVSLSVQSVNASKTNNHGTKINKVIKVNVPARFVKVTFGTNGFDVPQIAIALLIVGVIIGLSGLILSIFEIGRAHV